MNYVGVAYPGETASFHRSQRLHVGLRVEDAMPDYRVGDVVLRRFTHWETLRESIRRDDRYAGTLLREFVAAVDREPGATVHDDWRIWRDLLDSKDKPFARHFAGHLGDGKAVMHLRLGDLFRDESRQQDPFPSVEVREAIHRRGLRTVMILTAVNWSGEEWHWTPGAEARSAEWLHHAILSITNAGATAEVWTGDVDETILALRCAPVMLGSNSVFPFLAKAGRPRHEVEPLGYMRHVYPV